MSIRITKATEMASDIELSRDAAVRAYPDTAQECAGRIVEDFGEFSGVPVTFADGGVAAAARRWAVLLDSGDLVFLDSHQVAPG